MLENKNIEPVILQVLPEMNQGGVERGTIEIATALNKIGIKSFVASQGGRLTHNLKKINVKHFELELKTKNPIKMYKNSIRLEKIIKENGINIVHARSRAPAWSAYWAAKRAGVTYLTSFHGTYGLKPLWLKKPYNSVMTYGKKIIAVSNHIKGHIIKNYDINKDKIITIHRGVDVEKFCPSSIKQEKIVSIIKEHNIPEDKPIILLIGRLTSWKGQQLLIEAASKLKDKNFHCILLGDDQGRTKYTQSLKQAIEEKNLGANFSFIRHSNDVPEMMYISSIIVSASSQPEAFGRIAIEGQAMGKIVIASNIGGSLENVIDGISGKLFENKNPQSLADALDWALSLPNDKKEQISKAAIKNVHDNFTTQKMCDKTIDVYYELMKTDK